MSYDESYCPWCDKTQIRCSDPPACIMGETACSDAQAIWRLQARVAELEAQVPRWISVDEKPKMAGVYLCEICIPENNVKWYDTRGFLPSHGWMVDEGEHIVRWMPIPPTAQEDA